MASFIFVYSMLVLVVAFGLNIVCIVADKWVFFPGGEKFSLWKFCTGDGKCEDAVTNSDLDTVRAFMLIGVVLGGIALIVAIVGFSCKFVKSESPKCITPIACVLCFISTLSTLISILVYETRNIDDMEERNENPERGWTFWILIPTIILYGLAAVLFFICFIREARERYKNRPEEEEEMAYEDMTEKEVAYFNYGNGEPIYYMAQPVESRSTSSSRAPSRLWRPTSMPMLPYYGYNNQLHPVYPHGDLGAVNPAYRMAAITDAPRSKPGGRKARKEENVSDIGPPVYVDPYGYSYGLP